MLPPAQCFSEAEGIRKRWQEYTEELYKKDLHYPDNHDGVITHLEPDILECEECLNYLTIALISHTSKFSKPGFSNMWTMNFQMFKLVLEKAEEPEIKLPTSAGSSKNQESSRKNIYFCFIDYAKAFSLTVWITINCGKFWKKWEYQTIWPASWETCMQVRKQQLELDM